MRRLDAGGKQPWRGFRHLEHGHEWGFEKWHWHRADGKESRGGEAWRAVSAHRARRLATRHHGTGAKGHAHGAQDDPEHDDYAGDPTPSSQAHRVVTL